MTQPVSRRNALGMFSTIGLGALLASCASGNAGTASAPTTEATLETAEGETTTVSPQASGTLSRESFAAAGACTLTRELTEGPYYFDVDSIRSDIREDRPGTTLRLGILVQDSETCDPIPNAVVDVWHCDAEGIYSGFESASEGSGGPAGGNGGGGSSDTTDDETYLRGAQVTNAVGIVEFVTIYPGWYRGRTVHIHCKVHLDRTTLLTTQLFFDDTLTAEVYATEPYSDDGRDIDNASDSIFEDTLVLTVSPAGDGYLGLITFGVDPA
ncbi:MAG: intradiol ring-cleavage dioxygenase [Acidimicrobiales bacterium]